MKQQIVVTSYCRPRYLLPCLESLRANSPEMEIYVVDGGSDPITVEIVKSKELVDGYHLMKDNPGADVLKNEGIERFITEPLFFCTSDDFIFPLAWDDLAMAQFEQLRAAGRKFGMLACPTELVIQRHAGIDGGPNHYERDAPSGLDFMSTSVSMVAGTILDTAAVSRCGGFPVYGKTGQGDIALSRRLRRLGFIVGYLREPVLVHLGQEKDEDYPEYSAAFAADDAIWQRKARQDDWKP